MDAPCVSDTNYTVSQSISRLMTTQLWIGGIKPTGRQRERKTYFWWMWAAHMNSRASHVHLLPTVSQDTRFVGAGVESKAKPDTCAALEVFGACHTLNTGRPDHSFSRVGGTRDTSTVSGSRSCQSIEFMLISCTHPPASTLLLSYRNSAFMR